MKSKDSEGTRLLRVTEVALRLGYSRRYVYSMAASGELPSIKFQRGVRFEPKDVEAYIRGCKRGPRPAA